MNRQRSELWVGMTVLAALAVFLYATFRIEACTWVKPPGLRVVARFDNVQGVEPRTEVTIAGVRVGEVEEVALENGRAKLVLRIDRPGVAIPIDSMVAIRSRGLIGERVVEIVPGTAGQLVADGGTLTRTAGAPNLDRLLDRLAAVADDVKAVTESLRVALGGPEGEATVAEVVENVRVASREMRSFIEENRPRFATVLSNFEQFSGDLAKLTRDNQQTVADLLRNFEQASAQMETAIDQLAQASEKVNRGEGTLGKLVQDEELYDQAKASLDDLRAALREVRRAAEETQEQLPVTILGSVVSTLF